MALLSPNQECRCTEGKSRITYCIYNKNKHNIDLLTRGFAPGPHGAQPQTAVLGLRFRTRHIVAQICHKLRLWLTACVRGCLKLTVYVCVYMFSLLCFCLLPLTPLVGNRKDIWLVKKTGCWFVSGDDLTGALHVL